MKDAYSVRDLSRILGVTDQCVLNDVKKDIIRGVKIKNPIKGHYDMWVFSFSEAANYLNAKRIRRWH